MKTPLENIEVRLSQIEKRIANIERLLKSENRVKMSAYIKACNTIDLLEKSSGIFLDKAVKLHEELKSKPIQNEDMLSLLRWMRSMKAEYRETSNKWRMIDHYHSHLADEQLLKKYEALKTLTT